MYDDKLLIDLRTIRKDQNISASYVAAALGVNESTVSRWENGKISPKFINVVKWCNALGLTLQINHCTKTTNNQ